MTLNHAIFCGNSIAFIQELGNFTSNSHSPVWFGLDGLTLRQKLNESLGTWMLRFFNEKTGIWEGRLEIAFAWNALATLRILREM